MKTSQRVDGRGHWPRGKHRNPAPAPEVLSALRRAHRTAKVSYRGLARSLEVNDRTVRRWAAGEDHPAPGLARRLARLIAGL